MSTQTTDDDISLDDIRSPVEFAEEYPNLVDGPGKPKLAYLLRQREVNGLVSSGAVVEPAKRRPMIVVPKFRQWLLGRRVKHGLNSRKAVV